MQKACVQCGRPYEALTDKSAYCSGRCRAAASRKRRTATATAPLDRATLLLGELQAAVQEAQEALGTGGRKGRRRT